MSYHVPVMLNESVDGLKVQPNGTYVDLTYGGGGHSAAILSILKNGKLYAFDQDLDAVRNRTEDPRLTMVHGNFRFMKNYLRFYGVKKVDGILADLGVSSFHFDEPLRGFSFRTEGPLDMRMNREGKLSAAMVIQDYEPALLVKMFRDYGEISNAPKLVSLIVNARMSKTVETIQEFISIIKPCIPPQQENKYLAKVFQALRIEVNQEMEALKQMLTQCLEVLDKSGRLVIISYHSLEDRIVKNFTRTGDFEGKIKKDFYGQVSTPFRLVNKKVIVPGEDEIQNNSRARSAKLRIAEKI